MDQNGSPTPEAQIEWMQSQLNDAYLVIGRQQVALLRAEQVVTQLQDELQQKEEATVGSTHGS